MRSGLGILVAMVLTVTGAAQAQRPALDSLKPGQTVRVRAGDEPRFTTRLGPTPTELFVRAERPFEPGRVDSLWVRGSHWKAGAIVGAAVVTPAAFGFFAWICTWAAEGTGCDEWGKVTGFSLVAGAGGALLGAGVGALIPKWKLRYARDREATLEPLVGSGRVGVSVRF
ncbi:MAG TPA: hypothetical protein VFH97_01385 [Gemmatimonadales bacterium]|nr:hypothetical protein [Gemmatimonadales bacterium]